MFKLGSNNALLQIKLATNQVGTTVRSLSQGIGYLLKIDNTVLNSHLVSGIDYLIPSGVKDDHINFITNEVKKNIYLEDITEIIPIGANLILITLKINNEIYEAYCSSIKYGTIREGSHNPHYRKYFFNLTGSNEALEHLNKTYNQNSDWVNSLESSCIVSLEPYLGNDEILEFGFSDWGNPYSAYQKYSYKDIDHLNVTIDWNNRIITLEESFEESFTGSDHDGGFETTTWVYNISCTKRYASRENLTKEIIKWEQKGFKIEEGKIHFNKLKYWVIESLLEIKFHFSNNNYTSYD